MEISEVRSTYIGLRERTDDNSDLTSFGRLLKNAADAIRDTLAEAMRAKLHKPRYFGMDRCIDCEALGLDVKRHAWTDAQWQQAAHARLLGEG